MRKREGLLRLHEEHMPRQFLGLGSTALATEVRQNYVSDADTEVLVQDQHQFADAVDTQFVRGTN
jgi:hypothetical protein